jgi:subtilase family serine protease
VERDAGNHTVTAAADDVNRFAESNENNNSSLASFTVRSGAFPTSW